MTVEVLAEQVRPRRQREDAVHRREPAELARHVVRGRRHRAERRAADDDVDVAEAHEIGQVRVAAGKLRDLRLARHVEAWHAARRQTLAQPGDERAANRAVRRTNALASDPSCSAASAASDVAAVRGCAQSDGATLSCAACASTIPTKLIDLQRRLDRVHGRARLPERSDVPSPDRRRRSLAADGDRRGAEAEGARRRAVEPVSARERVRRRADQRRVRAALRDHGTRARLRAGGLQLLGARHRQHGSAGALRHRGAAQAVARAAARRQDPLLLRDDRARRRLVGRDQHQVEHRARRRRLRHQRPQVVDLGRRRSALPHRDLHGQVRSDAPRGISSSR